MALRDIHESMVRRDALSGIRNGIQIEHFGSASSVEKFVGKAASLGARAIEGFVNITGIDADLKARDDISRDQLDRLNDRQRTTH